MEKNTIHSIQKNIDRRRANYQYKVQASRVFEEVLNATKDYDVDALKVFLRRLEELISELKVGMDIPIEMSQFVKMSDDEARKYGRCTTIQFGTKHKGKKLDDIPLEYLLWLDREGYHLAINLRRYLASDVIQKEIDKSGNV